MGHEFGFMCKFELMSKKKFFLVDWLAYMFLSSSVILYGTLRV